MKKIIYGIIIFCFIILLFVCYISKKDNEISNNKIIVSEVTHSVFYAPWYVALEKGYFEDLDVEVILTSGANNVIASLISNDANIGLCGAEATYYVNDNKDKIKAFAALTKRDGQFLVLKNDVVFNNLNDLNGKRILSGRAGGMPLLSFTKALQNEKIDNVIIDNSVDFANLSAAFISGDAEGVNLFELNATIITH